jgi:hypothetical protein
MFMPVRWVSLVSAGFPFVGLVVVPKTVVGGDFVQVNEFITYWAVV